MAEIMTNATRILDLDERFQNFQLLIQIAKVQAIQMNQEIWVKIEIPQPKRVAFDLYKVYTIPAAVDDDGYHIYDLDAEFVAANNYERQYVLFNYQQYQKCQQLVTTADHPQFLCPQVAPTITAIGDNCALNLFRSFNVNTKACKEKIVKKWNSLVRMVTRNNWLFVMAQETKLEVNCRNLPTAIGGLSATGVLMIEEHCQLQVGDLLIASEDDAQRNISLWQPSRSELPDWDSITTKTGPGKLGVTGEQKHEVRLLAADNFNQAWKDQETAIRKVQDTINQEESNRQQGHPHHIYLAATSVTGCLCIFSLIIIAGVVIHLKRWKKKHTNTSRLAILPTIQKSSKHPHIGQTEHSARKKEADTSVEVVLPTTASLPTANLPTVVGKQLVQLE